MVKIIYNLKNNEPLILGRMEASSHSWVPLDHQIAMELVFGIIDFFLIKFENCFIKLY